MSNESRTLEPSPNSPRMNWRPFNASDTKTFKMLFDVDVCNVYVGAGGNIAYIDGNGHQGILPSVPSGSIIPGWFKQVLSTGTAASGLVAIW